MSNQLHVLPHVGEVKMSLNSSTSLATYLCCVEGPIIEALAIMMIFYSPYQTMKTKNISIWDIISLHYFIVNKETVVVGATLSIL